MRSRDADPIAFFQEADVVRLTGLTKNQLRYWHESGFFSPQNRREDPSASLSLYDFKDVVGLRAVAKLRRKLSLQHLREIDAYLHKYATCPWSRLKLRLCGRELILEDPVTGVLTSTHPLGQTAHAEVVKFAEVAEETKAAILEFRRRPKESYGKIEQSRRVQGNAPVIAGTRIPAATVVAFHEAGYSEAQIKKEFPSLSSADILAAISYRQKPRAA